MIDIEEMIISMHNYIDPIVNVKGDGNYDYHIVSILSGNKEENHTHVHKHLIKELKVHKESYKMLYGKKEQFD